MRHGDLSPWLPSMAFLAPKIVEAIATAVPSQNLKPDILMMQPAKDGNCRASLFAIRGECLKPGTTWRREVNSNRRYRF
jgi:hypothetical protein